MQAQVLWSELSVKPFCSLRILSVCPLFCPLLDRRRRSNSSYGIAYVAHLGEKLWYNPSFLPEELDQPDLSLGSSFGCFEFF